MRIASTIATLVTVALGVPALAAECPFPAETLAGTAPAATGFIFTEGPVWDGKAWLFSDIPADAIYRLGADGRVLPEHRPSGWANGNALGRDGKLLSARHDRTLVSWGPGDEATVIADRFGAGRLNSPNDVVAGSDGAAYFTDPTFGITGYGPQKAAEEQPVRGVYRLGPDRSLTLVSGGFRMPNGLAFEPGERSLLVSDTETGTVSRVSLDGAGAGGAPQTVLTIAPGIDGLKVDDAGRVYVAEPGGIGVYADGKRLCKAPLEAAHVSNIGLGRGEALVTASDRLFLLPLVR